MNFEFKYPALAQSCKKAKGKQFTGNKNLNEILICVHDAN